ncbi:MAG: hypothetical protein U1F67_16515 [Rubrivivax sp.]
MLFVVMKLPEARQGGWRTAVAIFVGLNFVLSATTASTASSACASAASAAST